MVKKIKNFFSKFKTELLSLLIFSLFLIFISKKLEARGLFLFLIFISIYLALFLFTYKFKYRKTLYYIQPFLAVNITASIVFKEIIMSVSDYILTYVGSFAWLLTAILLVIQAIRDKKINWFNVLYLLLVVGFCAHILLSSVFGINPL